jgi:2-polyprenyl-3-methyl-5-hydroxy-6-metoxy-1,4-benzoquinol methylase
MKTYSRNKGERFWDRTASSYDKAEKKDGKIFLQIIKSSKSYLSPAVTVLDFGCGTGNAANELSGFVKSIDAIDFSSKMIEIAKRKVHGENIKFIQTTIFDDRLKPGSYDFILSFYILHLLEEPQPVIKRMHELLKPGGLLISVTPCMGEKPFLNRLFSFFSRFGIMPPVKAFTIGDLKELLTTGRFDIKESKLLPGTSNQYFVVAKKQC